MNCKEIKELMSLKIDDLLTEEEEQILNDHLAHCEECKTEYNQLIETVKGLKEVEMLPLPDGFKESLHEKLLQEKKQSKIMSINWRKYSAIAAIFLIGVVALLQTDLLEQTMNQVAMKNADMAVEESGAVPEEPMAMKSDDTYGEAMDSISEDAPMADVPEMSVTFTSEANLARNGETAGKENYLMIEQTFESKTSYYSVEQEDFDALKAIVEDDFYVDGYKYTANAYQIVLYVYAYDYDVVIQEINNQMTEESYIYKEVVLSHDDYIKELQEEIMYSSDTNRIEEIEQELDEIFNDLEIYTIKIQLKE